MDKGPFAKEKRHQLDALTEQIGKIAEHKMATTALAQSEKRLNDIVENFPVDLKMPGMTGEKLLQALKEEHPLIEVIILTGHGTIDSAAQCTRDGAYSYLQKPCELDQILETLVAAYKKGSCRNNRSMKNG